MATPMQLLLMALLIPLTALAQGSSPSGSPSPAPSPSSGAPAPFSPFHSPPAPPTDDDDLPEDDSPTPSPASSSPSADSPASEPPLPSDAPSSGETAKKIDQASSVVAQEESGGGGMSGGHKAGLAVGLILAAAVVGLGAFVYKKRQENLRRAQYGIQMI